MADDEGLRSKADYALMREGQLENPTTKKVTRPDGTQIVGVDKFTYNSALQKHTRQYKKDGKVYTVTAEAFDDEDDVADVYKSAVEGVELCDNLRMKTFASGQVGDANYLRGLRDILLKKHYLGPKPMKFIARLNVESIHRAARALYSAKKEVPGLLRDRQIGRLLEENGVKLEKLTTRLDKAIADIEANKQRIHGQQKQLDNEKAADIAANKQQIDGQQKQIDNQKVADIAANKQQIDGQQKQFDNQKVADISANKQQINGQQKQLDEHKKQLDNQKKVNSAQKKINTENEAWKQKIEKQIQEMKESRLPGSELEFDYGGGGIPVQLNDVGGIPVRRNNGDIPVPDSPDRKLPAKTDGAVDSVKDKTDDDDVNFGMLQDNDDCDGVLGPQSNGKLPGKIADDNNASGAARKPMLHSSHQPLPRLPSQQPMFFDAMTGLEEKPAFQASTKSPVTTVVASGDREYRGSEGNFPSSAIATRKESSGVATTTDESGSDAQLTQDTGVADRSSSSVASISPVAASTTTKKKRPAVEAAIGSVAASAAKKKRTVIAKRQTAQPPSNSYGNNGAVPGSATKNSACGREEVEHTYPQEKEFEVIEGDNQEHGEQASFLERVRMWAFGGGI